MASPLPEGIYEHLLTQLLERDAAAAAPARSELHEIERADLPAWLSRHFARELESALRDVGKVEDQVAITHRLLARLAEVAPGSEAGSAEIASPARVLRSVYRTAPPLRPASPLSTTTLLTRAPKDPALGHAREHGVERRKIEGVSVSITTPAKTVADCFRYRRHVGMEVALAALRDFLGRARSRGRHGEGETIDALVAAGRADRISTVLRPYLEALA